MNGKVERLRRELADAMEEAGIKQPAPSAEPVVMSRHTFAMLCNVLWHHQGGSSPVGQPISGIVGIGQHDRMTDEQLDEAKWIDRLLAAADQPAPQPNSVRLAEIEAEVERLRSLLEEARDDVAIELDSMRQRYGTGYKQQRIAHQADLLARIDAALTVKEE